MIDFFGLHEKSLDLSNYEIFPHKILKSRTFKKSSVEIVKIISSPLKMSSFLAAAAVPTGAAGGEGAADVALRREGRAGDGGGARARHPRPPPPLQLSTRPPAAGGTQQVPRVEGSCPA
jgi:hypothetical protein